MLCSHHIHATFMFIVHVIRTCHKNGHIYNMSMAW